jgi:hypothetical protein
MYVRMRMQVQTGNQTLKDAHGPATVRSVQNPERTAFAGAGESAMISSRAISEDDAS